jgi:hypothetical protein
LWGFEKWVFYRVDAPETAGQYDFADFGIVDHRRPSDCPAHVHIFKPIPRSRKDFIDMYIYIFSDST